MSDTEKEDLKQALREVMADIGHGTARPAASNWAKYGAMATIGLTLCGIGTTVFVGLDKYYNLPDGVAANKAEIARTNSVVEAMQHEMADHTVELAVIHEQVLTANTKLDRLLKSTP